MKRPFGFASIVGGVVAGVLVTASSLLAEAPRDAPPSDVVQRESAQPAAVANAENDSMCEIDAAGPMCCDQSLSQNDSLHTVRNSLMTAGTAAVGLAAVGLLIKRRRVR